MQDLNFVIRFEIFVHFDGQLRATHLILGHTPAYTSFQDPSHELTVGSPLLSYLDVRLRGFLPKGLTLGELGDSVLGRLEKVHCYQLGMALRIGCFMVGLNISLSKSHTKRFRPRGKWRLNPWTFL